LISLLVLMSSLAGLTNAALSQVFGKEFSYQPETVFRPTPIRESGTDLDPQSEEEVRQQREEGLSRAVRRGVIDGISTTLVAGLLFAAPGEAAEPLKARKNDGEVISTGSMYLYCLLSLE
jgi:hypothetical protein